jgi:hypothetical protein
MYNSEFSQYFHNTNIRQRSKKTPDLYFCNNMMFTKLHGLQQISYKYVNQWIDSFQVAGWILCVLSTPNLTALLFADTVYYNCIFYKSHMSTLVIKTFAFGFNLCSGYHNNEFRALACSNCTVCKICELKVNNANSVLIS